MPLGFGLFSMTTGPCSYPESAARVARAAEAAGFDSLWGGEHVVLPDPQAPPSPLAPGDRIGTGRRPHLPRRTHEPHPPRHRDHHPPQRHPLVLAKELATLDVLSNGRLIFGVGVGYLEPEFRALGAPFEDRGRVTDEYLAAMRAMWTQDEPAYRGRFAAFEGVQAHPRPVQKPTRPSWSVATPPPHSAVQWSRGTGGTGSPSTPLPPKRCIEGERGAAPTRPPS